MSRIHKRNKGTATTKRQSRDKPVIVEQAPVETVTEPTEDVIVADMSMSKKELKVIARTMGLDTKGNKQGLIDRIQG